MEYVSDYIEKIIASIKAIGSEFEPRLESKSLAGLMDSTFDATSLRERKSSVVYVATVGSGEMIAVETGANDVTMQMVAYLMVVDPDSEQRSSTTQRLLIRLVNHISGQRWGLSYAHPAAAVESIDLHGLTKGFKPDTSSWRLGVSVLAHAADLYGGEQPDKRLGLWAISWEQKLRIAEPATSEDELQTSDVLLSRMYGDTLVQKVDKYQLVIKS